MPYLCQHGKTAAPCQCTSQNSTLFRWVTRCYSYGTSATWEWQWYPTSRAQCRLCSRCQQYYHEAASCQLPASSCLWPLLWTALFVWECEARFESNFVPTCALCKIWKHTAKLRGCPFFQDRMEKERRLSRIKSSQIRQRTSGHNEPDNVRTARGPQKHTAQRPPFSALTDYQQHLPAISVNNVWSRPLKCGNQTTTQRPQT